MTIIAGPVIAFLSFPRLLSFFSLLGSMLSLIAARFASISSSAFSTSLLGGKERRFVLHLCCNKYRRNRVGFLVGFLVAL